MNTNSLLLNHVLALYPDIQICLRSTPESLCEQVVPGTYPRSVSAAVEPLTCSLLLDESGAWCSVFAHGLCQARKSFLPLFQRPALVSFFPEASD